jgi:hypothetical protein
MKLELKIVKEPEDTSDAKDGSRLLATVEILGAKHHLDLLKVYEDEEGVQVPENEEYCDTYEDLQRLYAARRYESFKFPGLPGLYIAFMTPFED